MISKFPQDAKNGRPKGAGLTVTELPKKGNVKQLSSFIKNGRKVR